MVAISVKGDIKSASRFLAKMHKRQIPFATSVAINRTLKDIEGEERERIKVDLDAPTPAVVKSIRRRHSTKKNLEGEVFILPAVARFLKYQISGGVRPPRGRVEFVPVNIRLSKYGNIPGRRQGKVGKLMSQPNNFVGVVNGVHGLWQRGRGRNKNKTLKLLGVFEDRTRYRGGRFPFGRHAQRVTNRVWRKHFDSALLMAIRSSKR